MYRQQNWLTTLEMNEQAQDEQGGKESAFRLLISCDGARFLAPTKFEIQKQSCNKFWMMEDNGSDDGDDNTAADKVEPPQTIWR